MKKWITATLAAVCTVSACVGFAACSQKEMQLDKEYVYSSISFKKAADITLSDVSSFIPFGYTDKISNISDFEKFLVENLDTYSIYRHSSAGNERIYLAEFTHSLRVTEGYEDVENGYTFWLTYKGETLDFGAVRSEDDFTFVNDSRDVYYFKNGAFHYDLELNEKFAVVYNYKM